MKLPPWLPGDEVVALLPAPVGCGRYTCSPRHARGLRYVLRDFLATFLRGDLGTILGRFTWHPCLQTIRPLGVSAPPMHNRQLSAEQNPLR